MPIYENMVLGARVQTAPLGGRDLTAYLASMLESCTTDPYSAQPMRRRLGIARAVKDRHAYVAGDFAAEVRSGRCGRGWSGGVGFGEGWLIGSCLTTVLFLIEHYRRSARAASSSGRRLT